MSVWKAIFLGLLQGFTEFLPVSSSGHLAVAQNFFGFDSGQSVTFTVLLHLGTLAAVCIMYRRDVWMTIKGFFTLVGKLFTGRLRREGLESGERLFLLLALVTVGWDFGSKTVYSSFALSAFVSICSAIFPMDAPFTNDTMLELCFAILLPAVGSAIVFNLGASTGGTDIVAMIIHKYTNIDSGKGLLIADVVKPHSAQAIRGLKDAGVRKAVMLTGDAEPVAKAVSAELGLDEYHAGLLPGDKVDQIETLLAAKRPKENLAFVGDGINDAPVLSRADVGIAMGALGSDAAIEAADVVLMDDDPAKIALAMRIARRTLRIVYQNIVFALAIKFACLVLGAIGMASMWTAIFADVGVMVLAVLNATRALYTKDLAKKNEQ